MSVVFRDRESEGGGQRSEGRDQKAEVGLLVFDTCSLSPLFLIVKVAVNRNFMKFVGLFQFFYFSLAWTSHSLNQMNRPPYFYMRYLVARK